MAQASRTQQERSTDTRRLLLDSTVACLVEHGYSGTTGPAVARRAGLSRGAQLHHFGTRDQMVVAAVEYLAERRLGEVRRQLMARVMDAKDASDATDQALVLLAEALSGPLYGATLELWVAARTNVALREQLLPAESRVHQAMREICRTWITRDPVLIQITLDLLLGRGVSGMLVTHPEQRQREVLDRWSAIARGRVAS